MKHLSPPIFHLVMVTVCVVAFLGTSSVAEAQAPTISKVFNPNVIGPGSVSTITFIITNRSPSPVTGLSFTDTLPIVPGPMTIADPANASTNCNLGVSGSLSAPYGGSAITLSDAQIGALQACFVTVDVTAATPGVHTNPAITLSSSAGSSQSLAIDLTVVTTLPGFSKSFAPSTVPLGGRSSLTFIIDNILNALRVGSLDFTDNLPTGIQVADPANASTSCISASAPNTTITAIPGTNMIVLDANGSNLFPGFEVLPAGGTCTVNVDVVATGSGMLGNLTNDLLADFTSAGKASDTLEVTVTPLALLKSFTDDPVPPGSTATLEFRIDNFDRNFSATGLAFSDDLTTLVPALAGLTFDSLLSNGCGGSVSGVGSTTISLNGGTLAAEGSCTMSVSLLVPAGATPGVYTNTTSTITGTVGGSPVVGNMASDELFVEPVPVLTKEFLEAGTLLPDPVINPGDNVVMRFTITNTSTTSMATDVAFEDELTTFLPTPLSVVLPPTPCGAGSSLSLINIGIGGRGLSLTGGSLAAAPGPGNSCTFDVTLTTPVDLGPGVKVNTTERPTATVDGAARTGEPASDTFTVIAAPNLSKSFTDDPVAPGGTVTLEFTLTYPPDAAGNATGITFTDDLAALTPVLAGLTANFPPAPDPPCGAGSSLTGSAGDTLLTFMNGTLMPGESCTFSVTLNVPGGAAPGTYTNTTSGVGATVGGLAATSAPAEDDLNVSGLSFAKEFIGDPAIPGDTVILRFTIDNIHPTDDATDIGFTDDLGSVLPSIPDLTPTLPPLVDTCGGTPSLIGTTFLVYTAGSLTSGSNCTIDVTVLVPAGAADGDYINTTNTLTATQSGGSVAIDPAIDSLTIDSNLLQLTKAFTNDPVAPGDTVTLEFNLTNLDAGQAASAIDFSDDLGAALSGLTFDSVLLNTCGGTVSGTGTDMITVTGASLGAGGSCTLRASLTVPGAAAANIYPNTTSAVSGIIGGFAVSGDAASDNLEVLQLLLFSKSFDGPTAATGTATLTFTITNPGSNTVSDISFLDDLDSVISGLIAISLPALPCGAGSSITGTSFLAFTGGELPPMGGTCSFDVDVLVPTSATTGTFPNTTSDLTQFGLRLADPATADLVIEPPPTFAKVFTPDFIGLGLTSSLTFTIDNSASAVAAGSLSFTDNLPAGVVVANPPNAAVTCTGGTLTAVASSSVITYAGGTVDAATSCTIVVDVTGMSPGIHVNTSGDLSSSSGNSGSTTDTLTVNQQPAFAKSFAPNPIVPGSVSTLTFSIDNSTRSVDATGLDFTDNLPAGTTIATPSNAATTCVGGTLTAISGTGVVTYTGGTVVALSACTVTVDVVGSVPGDLLNVSGNLTSSLGDSGTATDTLTVYLPPTFIKEFAPDTIVQGATSTVTFTIDNTTSAFDAAGIDFTDNLPVGMEVAVTPNTSTTCTGGVLSVSAGATSVSYTGGSVAAGSTCVVQFDITISTEGTITNLTEDMTSSAGNSGPASAVLQVQQQVISPIPTVTPWGILVLTALLAVFGFRQLRRLG